MGEGDSYPTASERREAGGSSAHLEVWRPEGVGLVVLRSDEVTVGRRPSADIVVADDRKVSRLHAVVRPLAGGWCVRDLSSRNGTFVNGERLDGDRPLRGGDEITVGSTRLVFRSDALQVEPTWGAESPPELTRRERDVLLAMFRPILDAEVFTEPASTREIAAELSVSEAAVKQHLARLYDKFAVYGDRRRVQLANEALRRGAITLAEVRQSAR